MSAVNNPLNYSKTQRIILLIDLTPLLHLQNPNSYLTPLLTSAKTLISFPPLSHSLSSYKLFLSSLSPFLSSSTLSKLPILPSYNPNYLSFNHFDQTLISLSETLNSVSGLRDLSGLKEKADVSNVAQVIHKNALDLSDSEFTDSFDLLGTSVRSNMVVLFSPVCRSFDGLCDFMGVDVGGVCDEFRRVFGYLRDAFVSRDVHFSWVDVRYDTESGNKSDELDDDECSRVAGLFQTAVEGLGWGFCSSDLIVFGSALVSFGLIYPLIGVSPNHYSFNGKCKKTRGSLILEILDVSGKPLECKCCDLQLLDLKTIQANKPDAISHVWNGGKMGSEDCCQSSGVWEGFSQRSVKIDVEALGRHFVFRKMEGMISDVVLVHELSVDSKKHKEPSSDFFADRVLDLFLRDKSIKRRTPPLWQILLSFLYRRACWALVSLSNADGITIKGILKPFTTDSAYLLILNGNGDPRRDSECGQGETNQDQFNSELGDNTCGFGINTDSATGIVGGESRRKNKKHLHRYKDLSWSSFCEAAYEHSEMELEEAYFYKGCDTSKKLKFLKCWMKQIVKKGLPLACKSDIPNINPHDQEKIEQRLKQLHQESEQPLPLVEEVVSQAPQIEDDVGSLPDASDAFFSNLSERIQQGIESGVDLAAFSDRIVQSCIYWLSRKLEPDINEEHQASVEKSDGSNCLGPVGGELMKILLQDPKGVAGKHKGSDLSSMSDEPKMSKTSSGNRVREYELQILFRMEILQSEIAVDIRESTKNKFVKHICSLLESIQCNMEDGFFGDFNLNDYVARILGSRYAENLGGVVHKIYEQMDLLLFDDEDESPNLLLNSEDSNQSWRAPDNDKRGSEPNSTDSFPDHERKLVEAQERRQRALRFGSSTRRAMPELQRVWAPKPTKLSRSQSDSFRRSKRKSRHREKYDVVCETPDSGAKKCLFPSEDNTGEQAGSSVPRALFQNRSFDLD